jgi:hypothetical protein
LLSFTFEIFLFHTIYFILLFCCPFNFIFVDKRDSQLWKERHLESSESRMEPEGVRLVSTKYGYPLQPDWAPERAEGPGQHSLFSRATHWLTFNNASHKARLGHWSMTEGP